MILWRLLQPVQISFREVLAGTTANCLTGHTRIEFPPPNTIVPTPGLGHAWRPAQAFHQWSMPDSNRVLKSLQLTAKAYLSGRRPRQAFHQWIMPAMTDVLKVITMQQSSIPGLVSGKCYYSLTRWPILCICCVFFCSAMYNWPFAVLCTSWSFTAIIASSYAARCVRSPLFRPPRNIHILSRYS